MALGVVVGLAIAGPAIGMPSSPSQDAYPHVRVVSYDPNQTVSLVGVFGFQIMVQFAADERIENVAIGDGGGWQVTPNQRANLLFLKPLSREAPTNLTVMTDRRRYLFELSAVAPEAANSADIPYVLEYTYPKPVEAAPSPPLAKNRAYRLEGDATLWPNEIFDDGVFTYFHWPEGRAIPAVFSLSERNNEGLINYAFRQGYLVVEQVGPGFLLRSGKAEASVLNQAIERQTTVRP